MVLYMITKKKEMGKKSKKSGTKNVVMKSKEERQEDVTTILSKLNEVGLPYDHPSIMKIRVELNKYVNEGFSTELNIPITGFKRRFRCVLSQRKDRMPRSTLQHDPDV